MAVFDLIDHGSQFAAQTLTQPYTEDLADAIGCQTPEPDFTASLEELVDREMTFENEIAAVFDLRDGVETRQVHLSPFPLGELGSQDQGPVIELFADDAWTQPVGSRLQFGRIVYRQEGIVVFLKMDPPSLQFLFDEGVAVQPVGGVKRKETCHAHNDRAQNLIPDHSCPKQVGLPSEQKKSPPTMNVGEWFLWPELRQSSPTRKAKPSYKSPVSSINCCSIFRGWSSEHWSKKTTRNGVPKGLVAGHSWYRCYSANSPTPIPCARFATAWAVVWANWFISA